MHPLSSRGEGPSCGAQGYTQQAKIAAQGRKEQNGHVFCCLCRKTQVLTKVIFASLLLQLPGYHKIFIDRLWERLHGPALTSDDEDNDEENDIDKDDDNTKAVARRPNMKAASTSLVLETDRASTSDLMYFTLLQLEPYKPDGADSREIDLPGVVCRHCMNTPNGSKFFTTSSEHLGDLLVTISDHMSTCEQCPNKVKAEMATHQASHEMQLATLPEGDHDLCMQRVWNRLEDVNSEAKQPEEPRAPIQYGAVDGNMSLVSPSQESLVTPFTYYTFQQCRPCNLDNTKNGSRSNFDNGFPGIECLHCAGRPNVSSKSFTSFVCSLHIICISQYHGCTFHLRLVDSSIELLKS